MSTLTLVARVDVETRREGRGFRAQFGHGQVAYALSELDAAMCVARAVIPEVSSVRQIVSCTTARTGQGLFRAEQRTVKSL